MHVDQAVFTSVRSPTGEGYRVAAASPGMRPEEKTEITRLSPSHGSMADDAPGAVGLLAYPVPTGRYCVSHCHYAGAEPTARGGQRVWTHVALLDDKAYGAFGCNLIRVHRALGREITGAAPGVPGPALEQLSLNAWNHVEGPVSLNADDTGRLIHLVSVLLQGGRWVVAGTSLPAATLVEWALEMIPRSARPVLAVSAGLAFCLSRRLNLALLGGDKSAVQHMIRGHDIRWCDLDADGAGEPSAFDDWLSMVRNHARQGRLHRIAQLTARITGGAEPAKLRRIAQLCHEADNAPHTDECARAALRSKYASFTPNGDLERDLLDTIKAAIKPESNRV